MNVEREREERLVRKLFESEEARKVRLNRMNAERKKIGEEF